MRFCTGTPFQLILPQVFQALDDQRLFLSLLTGPFQPLGHAIGTTGNEEEHNGAEPSCNEPGSGAPEAMV